VHSTVVRSLRRSAAILVALGGALLMITFPFAAGDPQHGIEEPLPGWATAFERIGVVCLVLAAGCGVALRIAHRRGNA
jgi:hypothetical protein